MPELSGVEICRRVREDADCSQVPLVLFTGDDEPEQRQKALAAGADAVVVKSPDASELVEAVVDLTGSK